MSEQQTPTPVVFSNHIDYAADFHQPTEQAVLFFSNIKEEARSRSKINVSELQCYTDITTNESIFTSSENPYKKPGYKKAYLSEKLVKEEYQQLMEQAISGHFIFNQSIPNFLMPNENGINLINLHVPPTHLHAPKQEIAAIPEIYRDFFDTLIPNAEAREYTLDWIAASFTRKLRVYLTLIGEEGIGKGVLFDIISLLHGPDQSVKMNAKNLKSQFNAQIAHKSIIAFDEIKLDRENEPTIKLLESAKIQYEKKGRDAKEIDFNSNIVLMSNEYNQGLGEGSRRFAIPELTEEKMVDWELVRGNVAEYLEILKSPINIKQLFWYLHSRKFQMTRLDTPYKGQKYQDVVEAGMKEWEELARTYVMKNSPAVSANVIQHIKEKLAKINISTNTIAELFSRKLKESFRYKRNGKDRSKSIIEYVGKDDSTFNARNEIVNPPVINEVVGNPNPVVKKIINI